MFIYFILRVITSVTFQSYRNVDTVSILPRSGKKVIIAKNEYRNQFQNFHFQTFFIFLDCCHDRQSHFRAFLYRDDILYRYTDLFNSADPNVEGFKAYQKYDLHLCEGSCSVQSSLFEGTYSQYALSIHLTRRSYLTIAEVEVYTKNDMGPNERLLTSDEDYVNLRSNTSTSQSGSLYGGYSKKAIDGVTNQRWSGHSITHTSYELGWWYVKDFRVPDGKEPTYMRIWNRVDCCSQRLSDAFAILHKKNGESWEAIKATELFGNSVRQSPHRATYRFNEISVNPYKCSNTAYKLFGCV